MGSINTTRVVGSSNRHRNFFWILTTGLYEHVYIHEKHMCVGSCWKEPWKSKCENWETRFGKKYCKKLTCDHDKATRYSGCHRGPDGKRKLPWHK